MSAEPAAAPTAAPAVADVDAALDSAARRFDAQLCRELIESGASAKRVFHEGANDWYSGNTTTCLWNAIVSFAGGDATAQERFVDTMIVLLEGGADADFHAKVGNWNRVSSYSLFKRATKAIIELLEPELKKRAMLAFVAANVDLNRQEFRGKQGGFGGFGAQSYAIFDMVQSGDLELLALYLDAGVDPNCAESSWSAEFGDEGERTKVNKEHTPLLHAAVIDGNVDLARLLISKGADANQNMCFTCKRKPYLISCLQLASEQGDTEMVELLTSTGAQMEVTAALTGTVRMFSHFGEDPKPYEAGRWTETRAKKKAKGKGKKGKKKK